MKLYKILGLLFFVFITIQANAQQQYSFMVIHCDPPEVDTTNCGYPGTVNIQKLGAMVNIADNKGAKLTIQLSPAWVDSILSDSVKLDTVRAWRDRGHEIAGHHHHYGHQYWDGYMNDTTYADSIPAGCGSYLGQTESFYNKLRTICGDSLLLTLGQGPNNDLDFLAPEWSNGILYKTNDRTNQAPPLGGRVTDDAFSNVEKDTMGNYVVCKISYCFIDDNDMGYDSLYKMIDKMSYPAYSGYKVLGAVTHPFNYVPPSPFNDTIFEYWLDTITQLLPIMTVRDIMRAENCNGTTLTTGVINHETNKSLAHIYPNPTSGKLFFKWNNDFYAEKVEIYHINGQLISVINLNKSTKPNIDLSFLKPGMYFLQISSKEQLINKKFIKK